MAEESFLHYSSDEEVFIGKITDAEIRKMAFMGNTEPVPECRRSKAQPKASSSVTEQSEEISDSRKRSESIEIIDLSSQNDSVQIISDSDDSFRNSENECSHNSSRDRPETEDGGVIEESFHLAQSPSVNANTKNMSNVNLSFQSDVTENHFHSAKDLHLTSPSKDIDTTNRELDNYSSQVQRQDVTPADIDDKDKTVITDSVELMIQSSIHLEGLSNTDGEPKEPSSLTKLKSPIDKSKLSFGGNLPLNMISDSVLDISTESSMLSFETPDLHMSVDEADFQSALGSDVLGAFKPSSVYTASISSYCTAGNDLSAQQTCSSFEQYRTARGTEDLEELADIRNTVKETGSEAVTQNSSFISTFSESSDKPRQNFASKLPIFNTSRLIRPAKLLLKDNSSSKRTQIPTKATSTPQNQKTTSVPIKGSNLQQNSKTPTSRIPTHSSSKTPAELKAPLQPKSYSSSKKNNRYANVISPIRAYIKSNQTTLIQSISPTASKPLPKSVGKDKEPSCAKASPHAIVKKLVYKETSKVDQENVDPIGSRDTLPPRAFQHASAVFMKEPEHPARRLPKIGENIKKLISPKMKVTLHEGRVQQLPRVKGTLIPRITIQSPSPLKPIRCNNAEISIRMEK